MSTSYTSSIAGIPISTLMGFNTSQMMAQSDQLLAIGRQYSPIANTLANQAQQRQMALNMAQPPFSLVGSAQPAPALSNNFLFNPVPTFPVETTSSVNTVNTFQKPAASLPPVTITVVEETGGMESPPQSSKTQHPRRERKDDQDVCFSGRGYGRFRKKFNRALRHIAKFFQG